MNYPDLIWNLIEMLLQQEKKQNQKIDIASKDKQLDDKIHNKT